VIILCAVIGTREVAAYSIATNVLYIAFAVPYGASVALAVLTGSSVGENNGAGAASFLRLALVASLAFCVVSIALIYGFRGAIFGLYTRDAAVTAVLYQMLPYLLLFMLGDATQTVLQGAYRGVRRQAVSAKIVVFSLWCVGLPLSSALGLWAEWGVRGIVIGQVVAFAVEIPLLVWQLRRWDWNALADEASSAALPSPTTAGENELLPTEMSQQEC
jgi:MATE family multidrug resistance protein